MSDADYKDYSKFLTEALNAKFNLKKMVPKYLTKNLMIYYY